MCASETLPASRILLVADDRRFRALASTLLSRRGYAVSVCSRQVDLLEVIRREAIDVVLLDASASLTRAARVAARLSVQEPPVAIVAVSMDAHPGLAALPVVSKWGPAEALFAAIERACRQPTALSRPEPTSLSRPEPTTLSRTEPTALPLQTSAAPGQVTRVAS